MPFRHTLWIVAILFGFAAIAVGATPAHADFTVLTNPDQFAAGSTLITFDEGDLNGHILQPFENVTSYRGVGFQVVGAPAGTGAGVAFDPTPPREFGPGGQDGRTIVQVLSVPVQGLEITLPGPVNQFGAEFLTVTSGDFTFTLLAGGQQVDVGTIAAGQIGQVYDFHAFEDSNAFDEVIIQAPGPGPSDGAVILDNLRFGPVAVPEPGTMTLAGVGIVGLAIAAWRSRRRASTLAACV